MTVLLEGFVREPRIDAWLYRVGSGGGNPVPVVLLDTPTWPTTIRPIATSLIGSMAVTRLAA